MTTVAPGTGSCGGCRSALPPGARFCGGCGAPVAAGHGALRIPAPRRPMTTLGEELSPPTVPIPVAGPAPARRGWVVAGIAAAFAVALLAGVGAALVYGPWGAVAGPAVPVAAPTGPAVADPARELELARRTDAGAVAPLVGSWAPQLSTKRAGMVADGRTWDAAAILAEHRELRSRYPQARLVWSGDYASFRGDDFWVTVLARPFPTAAGANAWCDQAGLDGDHCYAKRLTRSGGPSGNSVMRDGAEGSATGTSGSSASSASPVTSSGGGAEPVLGDSGWAPGVTGYGTARPRELNANGDGTSVVAGVTWQSWGGPTATGRGTASWVPPDGFSSDGRPAPAVVVASDLGDCNGRLGYRRVAWYFPTKGETAPAPGDGYDGICTPA